MRFRDGRSLLNLGAIIAWATCGCSSTLERKTRTEGLFWAAGPGVLVHGAGSWYAGDRDAFEKSLAAEVFSLSVMVVGGANRSRKVVTIGGLLFVGGWLWDVYRTPGAVEEWNAAAGFGRGERTLSEVISDILELRGPPVPVVSAAPALAEIAAASKTVNVAVASFTPYGVTPTDAAILAEWVRAGLVKAGTVKVVDRNNMEKLLAEQAFQMTGCTTAECAVKIGKILNVQRMITGTVSKFQGTYVITVGVVDVESGAIIRTDMTRGTTADDLILGATELAERLAEGMI